MDAEKDKLHPIKKEPPYTLGDTVKATRLVYGLFVVDWGNRIFVYQSGNFFWINNFGVHCHSTFIFSLFQKCDNFRIFNSCERFYTAGFLQEALLPKAQYLRGLF